MVVPHTGPPTVLLDPRQALGRGSGSRRGGRRGSMFEPRRRRISPIDALLALAVLAVALFLGRGLWNATRVDVDVVGLSDGQALTFERAQGIDVRLQLDPLDALGSTQLLLDGEPLKAEQLDDGFRWKPDGITAGEHQLELVVPRPVLPESRFRWTFMVDATPPRIVVPRKIEPHALDQAVSIPGRIDDAEAKLTANGEPVDVDEDGRFSLKYDYPPAGPIRLIAADAAGHRELTEVFIPVQRPLVRGVHMSAISWRTPELRDPVLRLIDEGKINTVQLDIKDEGGEVGYDSKNPTALRIGAVRGYYELKKTVDELHERGVRVVARLVAFRDPILSQAAWEAGNRDWVVQRPDGSMLGAYGGFANFAHPAVQQYNLEIAMEAVEAGVDEILWDYIRRPEGALDQLVFPGIASTDADIFNSIERYLGRSHRLLRAKGVYQGASLFGIAADRPAPVGQNVPQIARHVDYISPMVYPSLWVPGEYRVPDPVGMPYEIVKRSLQDFLNKSEGTGVHMTPWLQDFSMGGTYGDAEVRAQIDGAESLGIRDWLLWSARVRYHAGMIDPIREG